MADRTDTDIAAFLVAQGLGTSASIKTSNMPATPDVMGCVYDTGGAPPDFGFGVAGVDFSNPAVQVVFRGAAGDYAGPFAKAQAAYRALAAVQPGTLPGVSGSGVYLTITPLQAPFQLKRDDQDQRVYIACNFLIKREP